MPQLVLQGSSADGECSCSHGCAVGSLSSLVFWTGLLSKVLCVSLIQLYLIGIFVYLFPSSYVEALMYLIYSYQYNKELLLKGLYRGHSEKLLGYYRRECLLVRHFTFLKWRQLLCLTRRVTKRALSVLGRSCFCSAVLCDLCLFFVTPFPLYQTSLATVTQQI